MSQTAYVLIEAEVGKFREVLNALRSSPGVIEAQVITGPYSLIAVLEADDMNAIGRLITDSVHSASGVLRTVSCLALES